MNAVTAQEIQTFGAGIVALAIVFSAFIYAILKMAPILVKINTQLEIANQKEDSTIKLTTAVDTLVSLETFKAESIKELKVEILEAINSGFKDLESHDENAQEIREIESRIESKLDGLTNKIYLLLQERIGG